MKKMIVCLLMLFCGVQLCAGPAGKVIQETVEAAARISGRTLGPAAKNVAQEALSEVLTKYGDDALRAVRTGGLEVLQAGSKYGDDFWQIVRNASPTASRSLALHADELMPLVRRLGDDFLVLEDKVPGLGAKVIAMFGDDGAKMLARQAPPDDIAELLGYAAKADSHQTRDLLIRTYEKSGRAILDHLTSKNILALGLSSAMIIGAGNVSEGVAENIKNDGALAQGIAAPVGWLIAAVVVFLILFLLKPFLQWMLKYWKKSSKPSALPVSRPAADNISGAESGQGDK